MYSRNRATTYVLQARTIPQRIESEMFFDRVENNVQWNKNAFNFCLSMFAV